MSEPGERVGPKKYGPKRKAAFDASVKRFVDLEKLGIADAAPGILALEAALMLGAYHGTPLRAAWHLFAHTVALCLSGYYGRVQLWWWTTTGKVVERNDALHLATCTSDADDDCMNELLRMKEAR